MIERPQLQQRIARGLRRAQVVVLLGPRQCGKSTLARAIVPAESRNYFDLEAPAALAALREPMTALASLRGTVVIDEVQRRPELFPVLRVLADRRPLPARFLILGSASPELLRQSSESLAGRMELIRVAGFSLAELGSGALDRHWLRGAFPRAYLARSEADSLAWRGNFVQAFLERDLPQLGITIPADTLGRFWSMLAHYHGGLWNAAELARSFGVSEPTVARYLDLLSGVFMVRRLKPWHENLAKRQVKSPKVYVRDSGLLHHLLGLRSRADLDRHPKRGASWEGYVIEEALKQLEPDEAYFWRAHTGAELDLLVMKGSRRIGIEAKVADAPVLTPSMRIAMEDLRLDSLAVLYPGQRRYLLAPGVEAVPASELAGGWFVHGRQPAAGRPPRRR